MGLLDGGRKKDLPTMSWESVLEEAAAADLSALVDEGEAEPGAPPEPGSAPPAAGGLGDLKLELPALDLSGPDDPAPPATHADPADHARPIVEPGPLPLPVDGSSDVSFQMPGPGASAPGAPPSSPDASAPPAPAASAPPAHPPVTPASDQPLGDPVSFSIPSLTGEDDTAPATPDAAELGVADAGVSAGSTAAPLAVSESAPPAPAAAPPAPDAVAPAPPAPVDASAPTTDAHDAEPAGPSMMQAALAHVESHAPSAAPVPPPPVAPETTPSPAAGSAPTAAAPAVPEVAAAPTPVVPAYDPQSHQPSQAAVPPGQLPNPLALGGAAPRRVGKRSRAGVVTLLLALLVIGGLVAAAVVYGRPYLFPEQWDENAEPYARAVEDAHGAEFEEPVSVNAEAAAVFRARRSSQLFGDWESDLPEWRALALANGDVNQSTVDELLDGWALAMYSYTDGQIYHDDTLAGTELDARIAGAMATALLDQELGWSVEQGQRSPDDAAMTDAYIALESRSIQQSTEFSTPVPTPDATPLHYLPQMLGYQIIAPTLYAELLTVPADAVHPLAGIGAGGPWPQVLEPVALATAPATEPGETVLVPAATRDRTFWYLVFASYVDGQQAYLASTGIAENTTTVVERDGRACVVANFSGGDVNTTTALGTAVDGWVAAAPVEMAATTTVLPDGTRQFTSCDPGAGFENGARFGTAHELLGYRMAEVSTVLALEGAPQVEIDSALSRLSTSSIGADLGARPFDTTPSVAAAAAKVAVDPIVDPALDRVNRTNPSFVPEPEPVDPAPETEPEITE